MAYLDFNGLNHFYTRLAEKFSTKAAVGNKADKATTLAGYGITDAKIEGNTIYLGENSINPITNVDNKANKATTLAGYGITDAKIEGNTVFLGDASLPILTTTAIESYPKKADTVKSFIVDNNVLYYELGDGHKVPMPTVTRFTGDITGNAATATSAASATKATQDSAGQQINTTYIKGLSVSGNVITITKGNGATSTITVGTTLSDLGSASLATITSKGDGSYTWSGTLNGVGNSWLIRKDGGTYTAICKSDPRTVFYSTDASNWYSPYASWHA